VLSPAVDNLVAQLTRLPGIGTRTAQRLAFHLLSAKKDEALALAEAIEEVKERVRFCRECGNLTEEELCGICADSRRDRTVVCVVEQPADVLSLERTHEYRGLYHVLGGSLSPLDGVEPEHLRLDELVRRVEGGEIQEVVLATNPNMTGEATAAYLADRLRAGNAARERAPGRRRSRVRGRGDARAGARRPPRDVTPPRGFSRYLRQSAPRTLARHRPSK
jgi:recombination protein RecR